MIKRQIPKKATIDLTPMVDIVFLLIIFFMTSSTLVKKSAIKIDLPKASSGSSEKEQPLTLLISKDSKIHFDNQEIQEENLQDFLKNKISNPQNETITIKGDKQVPYEKIIKVMGIVKNIGIKSILLSTEKQ